MEICSNYGAGSPKRQEDPRAGEMAAVDCEGSLGMFCGMVGSRDGQRLLQMAWASGSNTSE